jgi:hypothetical protein
LQQLSRCLHHRNSHCCAIFLTISRVRPLAARKITFIDKLIKKNERGDTFSVMDHQREILRLAFDFDQDGPVIMAGTSPALAPVRITILGSRARSAVGCSEHEPI